MAKEGARHHGYTGQRGYHPLLAVAAGTGDVLMARLREGRANTGEAHLEPVFGQAKQGRGFRQLLVQNLEKGNSERFLFWTGHNLLKVFFLRCRMTGRGWLAKSPMIQPWHRQYRVHPPP